jgi:hypothetical protein
MMAQAPHGASHRIVSASRIPTFATDGTYSHQQPGNRQHEKENSDDPADWRSCSRLIRSFGKKLKAAQGKASGGVEPWTFAALAVAYRGPDGGVGSAEWEKNKLTTKRMYNLSIDRIVDKRGPLSVANVTVREIYAFRDLTPALANKLVIMLRTLIAFGIPRGYIDRNPAVDVRSLHVDVENTRPWPDDAFKRILGMAPVCIRRAAFLGRSTGQRRLDLVKFGHKQRRADGAANQSRQAPRQGSLYPSEGRRTDGNRFLLVLGYRTLDHKRCGPTNEPGSARERAGQVFKPRCQGLNLHGPRAMAVCDRPIDGLSHQVISPQLCISMDMVMRYSKHIDQERLPREANKRRS